MRDSQAGRILYVLADGQFHTTSEIHRRAGSSRLNSRISDLRKQGKLIECEHIPHRKNGANAYRYRWLNPDHSLLPTPADHKPPEQKVPRDAAHRYRIYVVPRFGEQTLLDTAADAHELGEKLILHGEAGLLQGCCLGLLDSHGEEPTAKKKGEWLINPHEARW